MSGKPCGLARSEHFGRREEPTLRYLQYEAAPTRIGCVALAVVSALSLAGAHASAAADASPSGGQPDVQILVLQLDAAGMCNAAVTYADKTPLAKAQKDLDSIIKQTGWRVSDPTLTNNPATTPQRPTRTSVEFVVAKALSPETGGFPLEPLVTALKRFRNIEIVFAMRPEFRFQGLTNYENDYVRIGIRTGGQTYNYRVFVKRADFTKLDLPMVVEPIAANTQPPPRSRSVFWPLLISAAVGLGVWLVARTARTKRKAQKEI